MKIYCKNNSHVVQSVGHILRHSNHDSPWTMIIHPEKSGGYYVTVVTNSESDVIEGLRLDYSEPSSGTSTETTPAG